MNSLVNKSLEPYCLGSDATSTTAELYNHEQGVYFSVSLTRGKAGLLKMPPSQGHSMN